MHAILVRWFAALALATFVSTLDPRPRDVGFTLVARTIILALALDALRRVF
jgi:hypothetical protein